jgi:CheY-like chemotaxis protein
VEIMGGDIQLTSALGTGSQFKVALMLPWAEHDPAEVAPQRRIEGYQGTRRTIMVVDDDATVRGLINELLQPIGFNVLEAVSAEQCLADFAGSGADLYILDVNMPGKSGFELTALLRAAGVKAPIVMLSANAQIPDAERQQQLGFDQYLVKPLDNYRLLSSLATLLDVHWLYADGTAPLGEPAANVYQADVAQAPIRIAQGPLLEALFSAADIGYKRGMLTALTDLRDQDALDQAAYDRLVERVERLQFSQLSKMIEVV